MDPHGDAIVALAGLSLVIAVTAVPSHPAALMVMVALAVSFYCQLYLQAETETLFPQRKQGLI